MNATGSDSLGPVTAPQLRREVGVRTAVKHWPPGPGFPAVTAHRLPSEVPEAMKPAGECGPAGCTVTWYRGWLSTGWGAC